jgi:hypothetical protein
LTTKAVNQQVTAERRKGLYRPEKQEVFPGFFFREAAFEPFTSIFIMAVEGSSTTSQKLFIGVMTLPHNAASLVQSSNQ